MKAIIPVAGAGTHLRPHTYTQPKSLIPVAGKPILAFIVDKLLEEGFTEFIFVTGYLGEKIESYIKGRYPQLETRFVVQNKREGLGHAIWLTRDLIDPDEEIFIALGDTIFEANLQPVLNSAYSSLGVKKVSDPRHFGVAQIGEDGFIKHVVEKPVIPKSNLALVGLYKIRESGALMDALGKLITDNKKTQGEFHLTDGIMSLIKNGTKINSFKVENWYDCGKKEILLETNTILLKKGVYNQIDQTKYHNTIIIEPVSISPGCEISNSIIGPFVSIGENSHLDYVILQKSIIGNNTHLNNVILQNTVLGSDTLIKGFHQSLNIGDNTEIDFS